MGTYIRAAIYARVSTDEQKSRGYSLGEQVAASQLYADERGYEVVGIYQDDFTGMSMDRPELDRLREAVKRDGISVVIVTELDRWARKAIYQVLLEEEFASLGAKVEYVLERFDDSDEGQLFKGIKQQLGEYERAKMLRRLATGRVGKVKKGNVMTPNAPYGYKLVGQDGSAQFEIDEEEARVIKLMFTWYIYGVGEDGPMTIYEIAKQLTQRGYLTWCDTRINNRRKYSAGTWHWNVVRDMLHNEVYIGVWRYRKKQWVKGEDNRLHRVSRERSEWLEVSVPAIIDVDTFEMAQRRSHDNSKYSGRNKKHDYLLSSRIRCLKCGRAVCGYTPTKQSYYRCGGSFSKPIKVCTQRGILVPALDSDVWSWFSELLQNPEQTVQALEERDAIQAQQQEPLRNRLALIEKQLEQHKKGIARLVRNLAALEADDDDTTERTFQDEIARLQRLKADLERERDEMLLRLQRTFAPEHQQRLADYLRVVAKRTYNATYEQKRDLFVLFDLQVEITHEGDLQVAYVTCDLGKTCIEIDSEYAKTYMGIIRSHFVIDEQGKIADAQVKVSPTESIERALIALR